MNSLTIRQILDAFPDEILELAPLEISRLEVELKPLRDEISLIDIMDLDLSAKQFFKRTAIILSNSESKIDRLKQLKQLLSMKNIPKNSKNNLSQDKIQLAKQIPIKSMFAFDKIKQIGTNKLKASCPFHSDSNPSFYIYPTNSFHCFSCQAGGSNIDFYMKLNNLSFRDAVIALTQ